MLYKLFANNYSSPSSATTEAINNFIPNYAPNFSLQQQNNQIQTKNEKDGDFSEYADTSLHMGLTAQPGQARLKGLDSNLIQKREIINSPYSNNILENDCYQSERFEPFANRVRFNEGENQGIIYATPEKNGTDQPTKYGISQDAFDLYRRKFNNIANTYPVKLKDLTEDQAMNLLCQYYKGSRAEAINDPNLAFALFDSFFNGDKFAINAWQKALN